MSTVKTVFVTVGTTQFDELIKIVSSYDVIHALRKLGYTKMVIQIGNGTYEPPCSKITDLDVSFYRFKPSILADINRADLVISHAGAGSCLEVLGQGKPLVVVVNELLMHNHQTELAERLHEDGYVYYSTCHTLKDVLNKPISKLKKYPKGNPEAFSEYLNNCVGFSR